MYLEIITPDQKLFSGEVKSVTFPGKQGVFGVLNRHASIISSLKPGKIKVTNEAKQIQYFEVKGGVVEVLKNKVIVLAQ